MISKESLFTQIDELMRRTQFSGSVDVRTGQEIQAALSQGDANRSESLHNQPSTRFGIASGCKLFTAIAICQLVEKGAISFESRLLDVLDVEFPHFDERITIHHLLTHTAGIPDYYDEEVMDDFEALWAAHPMYRMRRLTDFLPLFQTRPMKLRVGERFHYNNAGYILLGLIVEHISQLQFDTYIQVHIFDQAGMTESGYFELDALPPNTAMGYIDQEDGSWRTNIYALPVKGGSDGGAFVTVHDMVKLWEALMNHELINEFYTQQLLTCHAQASRDEFYGYGVWIKKDNQSNLLKYHVMGYDPGVSFHSAYYPWQSSIVVVCSNKSSGAFELMIGIEHFMFGDKG